MFYEGRLFLLSHRKLRGWMNTDLPNDGSATARPPDPADLLSFANESEKFVEETETPAEDYASEGRTRLELCAQYCRACSVSVQRLFHVRNLGEVCGEAMRSGKEAFPLDLIEDLAQDDDSEVRRSIAEQLGVLADALREARAREEDDVAAGLLYVAFLLVEDDVDGVVSAAESAVAAVTALLEGAEGIELVLKQVKNLSAGEEEEIRTSAAKIIGSLAPTLGPEVAAHQLAPLLLNLAQDEALQIREVVASAIARVGEVIDDDRFEEILADAFRELARDAVWSVRKACAGELMALSKCASREGFSNLIEELFEPLANDVSFQVRAASLESLGAVIAELGRDRASESLVDHFVSMAESAGGPSIVLQAACAFNIPGVAHTIGRDRWGELRGAYVMLAESVQWKVRRTLACSLHVMAKVLGAEIAEADILPVFEEIIRDDDEVTLGAVHHLADFTRELPPNVRSLVLDVLPSIGSVEGKGVIGNWRLRAALTEQLGALSVMISAEAIERSILPLLLRLLRDPASAVRAKSAASIGGVLKYATRGSSMAWRTGYVGDALTELKLMATNTRWSDRQVFVQMCAACVGVVDSHIVIEEFVPLMLMAAEDTVPNVRRELARALVVFQSDALYAGLPDLRDAVWTLRSDTDEDVAQMARRCVFDDRGDGRGFETTGLR